jgi:hypothetical protein
MSGKGSTRTLKDFGVKVTARVLLKGQGLTRQCANVVVRTSGKPMPPASVKAPRH